MAISYHVFAARNSTPAEAAAAVPMLKDLTPHVEHGWVWYQVPPWDLNANALADLMARLPGPVLLATLHDYECWTLRLHAQGHMPFAICFEFSRLLLDDGPPADYPDEALYVPPDALADSAYVDDPYFFSLSPSSQGAMATVEELAKRPAQLGMPLPDEVIADLKAEPSEEVIDALLEWTCDEILDALETFGIPHDPDEVDAILLGDAVSDTELETPDANLPRLLVALGITEEAADWVARVSDGDFGPLDELGEARALREDLRHILAHSTKERPQPLEGGPIRLPIDDLDLLVRVVWCCSHMVGCAIGFDLPRGQSLEGFPLAFDWMPKGTGARTALYPGDFLESEEDRRALSRVLRSLPEGTELTLWFGDDTYAVARQCYAGVRDGDDWVLDSAAPPISAANLKRAMDFTRLLQRGLPLTVESVEEFEAACDLSVQTGNTERALPSLDGLTVAGDEDGRFEIAVSLFRLRFKDIWDTTAVQHDEETEAAGYFGELQQMFGRMAIPVEGEPIFQGEGRDYYRPDMDGMNFDGKRDMALAALERSKAAIETRSFEYREDLFCSSHPFEFLRIYTSPDRRSLLMESVGQLGVGYRGVVSDLAGHGILLTTTAFNRASMPHRGVMVRRADDPALDTLYAEHQQGLERLARRGVLPSELPASPEALHAFVEHYYFRIEGNRNDAPQAGEFGLA
jgi:hypothetical protein